MDDADLEDFDLNRIINYSHEKNFLILSCELKSGEILPVPFEQLKKDHPCETARCTKDMIVGRFRRNCHQKWALELLKQRSMPIRRMSSAHGVERACRVIIRRAKRDRTGKVNPETPELLPR